MPLLQGLRVINYVRGNICIVAILYKKRAKLQKNKLKANRNRTMFVYLL